ncbi:MAG: hypothetical protein PF693_21550 [Spirochaetia bacterium]|jgi:hypothetical protein|nr:hypothetical protein [Spirochaetia bacterium]
MAGVLIDLSNYDTLLVQSTVGRAGTPDGNVFFDTVNGTIEFLTNAEVPTIDLTGVGGGATDENQLYAQEGIKFEAVYAFENQERRIDEVLRQYDRWSSGTFKFGGAYNFVNSRKPSIDADRSIIRGSGWNEQAIDGGIDRIYFGNKGLSNVDSGSQPYYQLALAGAPTDFAKLGQIDEAVQVYGTTANVPTDATAGDFDTRTYEAVSVRTFGNNYDRKETTSDLGITELGGYSTGFALNESIHLTSGAYTIADVFDTPIAPWNTMTLEELDTPVVRDEFSDQTGTYTFTWVLNNPGTGTNASPVSAGNLNQMVAYLDAAAQTDTDINEHITNTTNGKRVGTWYTYNATGQIVTKSGADVLGLYLYNIPTSDQQKVVMTDDSTVIKAYSFSVSVEAEVGGTAKADVNAWFHSFFDAAYNTAGAITVLDKVASPVKGLASAANASNKIIFAFDYTGDTVGGTADTDKDCVFICEGDGGATQAKTLYTITQNTTVAFACAPGAENNA